MSIIKLPEPWCFKADENNLTQGELEELQSHFVSSENEDYDWCTDEWCGIDEDGTSNYHSDVEYFADDNDESKVTVYTIEQLRAIIAEHLDKQPVEKLEEGVVYYIHHTLYGDWQYLAINKVAYVNINQRAISTAGESWEHELRNKEKYVFTKATPAQIAHYEACVKAGKYVEPESFTEFVVGKWYKWFQKDHSKTHKGKCVALHNTHFEMNPWICGETEYLEGGMFVLKEAEFIEPIEDLSEIQEFLPEGHPDKVVKKDTELKVCETCNGNGYCVRDYMTRAGHQEESYSCTECDGEGRVEVEPKSERYLATMKFFEQLREPERSEAIANYDEDYGSGTKVPKDLAEALNYGFEWSYTEQEHEYWMVIKDEILSGIYFKEELLVFGKYKVGDIIVFVKSGKLAKILKTSRVDRLNTEDWYSDEAFSFRETTPEEVEAYNQGVRNIADIKPKDYKEAVHCTTQEEWDFVLSKLVEKRSVSSQFGTNDCVNIVDTQAPNNEGRCCPQSYYRGNGYTILNFKKWCEKYNHSYEVVPEYVECVIWSGDMFNAGKIYHMVKGCITSDDKGEQIYYSQVDFNFKPSTKEAYDKQQEKLKMEELLSEAKLKFPIGTKFKCYISRSVVHEVKDLSLFTINLGHIFYEHQMVYNGAKWTEIIKEEPWVAQVGNWVYVLNKDSAFRLTDGHIGKCVEHFSKNVICVTDTVEGYRVRNGNYRKATQEEIDSVTKTIAVNLEESVKIKSIFTKLKEVLHKGVTEEQLLGKQTEWTADNWYVEVTSQEEADAVIDAAAKMYGKGIDKQFTMTTYHRVGIDDTGDYCLIADWQVGNKKPRPITDFIQISGIIAEGFHKSWVEKQADAIMAGEYVHKMQEASLQGVGNLERATTHQRTMSSIWEQVHSVFNKHNAKQDELTIYKPKQTRLVEPGAVSASVSTINLIIKSNSKYL